MGQRVHDFQLRVHVRVIDRRFYQVRVLVEALHQGEALLPAESLHDPDRQHVHPRQLPEVFGPKVVDAVLLLHRNLLGAAFLYECREIERPRAGLALVGDLVRFGSGHFGVRGRVFAARAMVSHLEVGFARLHDTAEVRVSGPVFGAVLEVYNAHAVGIADRDVSIKGC